MTDLEIATTQEIYDELKKRADDVVLLVRINRTPERIETFEESWGTWTGCFGLLKTHMLDCEARYLRAARLTVTPDDLE